MERTSNSFPLNDTDYLAEDLRRWLAGRSPGIFNLSGSDYKVTALGGLNFRVDAGQAYVFTSTTKNSGIVHWDDAEMTGAVNTPSGADRYDYISITYSKQLNECNRLYKVGTSEIPKPIRNDNEWELIVAYIRVRRNAGEITQNDITDTRLDSNFCGLTVDTLTKIPTDSYAEQLSEFVALNQAQINEFRDVNQTDFDLWFENVKNQLSEVPAGNLQLQIDETKSEVLGLAIQLRDLESALYDVQNILRKAAFYKIFSEGTVE